jgi:hypothetical protein
MTKCINVWDNNPFTQIADNCSLVFIIFIHLFRQLKHWVGQLLVLVSCPKGKGKKNVNVEACPIGSPFL